MLAAHVAPTPQQTIPQDDQETEQKSSPSRSTGLSIILPAMLIILAVDVIIVAGLHYCQKHTGLFLSIFVHLLIYCANNLR